MSTQMMRGAARRQGLRRGRLGQDEAGRAQLKLRGLGKVKLATG
ncbi:hypothetical protein GGI55_005441 [Rhizobium leguminosarum]|nr:hypothetical protein [Rhizobium esperanzae]MBB4544481.1 hypothetical protein [Rhizobium leguminosarum]MBB5654216.1 hypothetical protein [Rhizobium leguminosarum]MBB5682107.1 hypothetical protein [Rhizobium leguminosarum]MBB6268100.1 hypothetical protein [Rhizobium leguminosarum]